MENCKIKSTETYTMDIIEATLKVGGYKFYDELNNRMDPSTIKLSGKSGFIYTSSSPGEKRMTFHNSAAKKYSLEVKEVPQYKRDYYNDWRFRRTKGEEITFNELVKRVSRDTGVPEGRIKVMALAAKLTGRMGAVTPASFETI